MAVEIAHFHTPVYKGFPYTHKQQVAIPSLGTYYDNLRVPDLLLTALYHLDPKTGDLVKDVKLIFQTDGPSDAQVNFKHEALIPDYTHRIYKFDVNMDIVFGEGVVFKNGAKVGGNIGAEKVVKGGLDIGLELNEERPGTRTIIHARIQGMLNAQNGNLEAWGGNAGCC